MKFVFDTKVNLRYNTPQELQKYYYSITNEQEVWVKGPILERLIISKVSENTLKVTTFNKKSIPTKFIEKYGDCIINIETIDSHFELEIKDMPLVESMLSSPRVVLLALYHKENFPLPRFPLGISDITAAVRSNYIGTIEMIDMQFHDGLNDVLDKLNSIKPDILGISATFGQQDILDEICENIRSNKLDLLVFGGSLAALNFQYLLKKYPKSIVSLGYGETTMSDIILYWHALKMRDEINHCAFKDLHGEIQHTSKMIDDKSAFIVPELDLLPVTLANKGVMQLESSRGCTYSCSFCPRSHKGKWSGNTAGSLDQILPFIADQFNAYDSISRKIFLVDEEFIGYALSTSSLDVELRALEVAKTLCNSGFTFESSTRMDQVFGPRFKDKKDLVSRLEFWKELNALGLRRMLFGLESGVDSILKRFRKVTSKNQNVIACRLLSLLGIPIRLTYITFDPLMSMQELVESYRFLGRTDIILPKRTTASTEHIVELAREFDCNKFSELLTPLYKEITYMLVSMECLIGSHYLKLVEKEGLATSYNYSMGKRNANYRIPIIGKFSKYSQLWIDRNFALDYLFKSIIKIVEDEKRETYFKVRIILKDFSYALLGIFLEVEHETIGFSGNSIANGLPMNKWIEEKISNGFSLELFGDILECLKLHLEICLTPIIHDLRSEISHENYAMIYDQFEYWKNEKEWKLIN